MGELAVAPFEAREAVPGETCGCCRFLSPAARVGTDEAVVGIASADGPIEPPSRMPAGRCQKMAGVASRTCLPDAAGLHGAEHAPPAFTRGPALASPPAGARRRATPGDSAVAFGNPSRRVRLQV